MLKIVNTSNFCRLRCFPHFVKYHQTSCEHVESVPNDSYAIFEQEFHKNHIELNQFQRTLLGIGSAAVSLINPHRGDMIACMGETTGTSALIYMREKMLQTNEGCDILRERPRINSKTVDFGKLNMLPEGTLGKVYNDFLIDNKITADSRLPVQFIDDIELGYVMQRYREVHDLVHACLGMKTNMLGEVTIKWVEGLQTRLPMCVGGGIFGAMRLGPKHRKQYLAHNLPWAIQTGLKAKFMQGVYFEKRWEQPLDEFYNEMNIVKFEIKDKEK